MIWRLNKIQYPVYNLGPGKRLGFWVQGCSLGCPDCVNKTLWSSAGGRVVDVLEIFNWVLSLETEFDGITISGGEPFEQYEQLVAFLHLIKKKTSLNVYCYSGYYLHELDSLFPDKLFYQYLDYLVDGRYERYLPHNKNIKGSANQTIYRFDNGVPEICDIAPRQTMSVHITRENSIYMAGIPKEDELKFISTELAEAGIQKTFK